MVGFHTHPGLPRNPLKNRTFQILKYFRCNDSNVPVVLPVFKEYPSGVTTHVRVITLWWSPTTGRPETGLRVVPTPSVFTLGNLLSKLGIRPPRTRRSDLDLPDVGPSDCYRYRP